MKNPRGILSGENASSRAINLRISVSEMFPPGFLWLFFFRAFGGASGLKTWIPRTNIDEKSNWNALDVPKNCDRVSFAVRDDLTVSWPIRDLLVTGLRLPQSGTVSFESDVSIRFTDESRCPDGRVMEYVRDVWKGWLDPANWKSDREEMWLPHAERIPCFGEDVKFPPGNNFAVTLPPIKLPIGKVYYDNEEYDGDDWADFLNTKLGKSQFRSEETSQRPWLHDIACPTGRKCTCGQSPYVFRNRIYDTLSTSVLHQAVCLYAEPSCGSPGCFSPVKPEGHCCGVCGAVFRVRDGSRNDRLLEEVERTIKRMKTDWNENVGYHVGRTIDENIEISVLTENSEEMSDALAAAASVKDYLTDENYIVCDYLDILQLVYGSYNWEFGVGRWKPQKVVATLPEESGFIAWKIMDDTKLSMQYNVHGRNHSLKRVITRDNTRMTEFVLGKIDLQLGIVFNPELNQKKVVLLIWWCYRERNFDVISSKYSGLTLSGYFFNSSSGIAFGTFCAVALFFLSLYLFYVVLPEKNFYGFVKMRDENPFRFARFKNVLHESGSEEKLEIGSEALARESSRGFHNPTFSGNSDVPSLRGEGKTDEGETETGRDYENPVYHEMENAREFIDGEPVEPEREDVNEFKEIEL